MLAVKKKSKNQIKAASTQLNFITAADHNYFVALQFLIVSIREVYPKSRLVCIDLGLSSLERDWLKEHKVELQKCRSLLMPKRIHYWQTWNKPQYILQQEVGNWLWLDADTIILDSLSFIERNIKNSFVVFTDTIAFKCEGEEGRLRLRNNNSLNVLKPDQYPNAGIVAFNIKRDKRLLQQWCNKIKLASENSTLYDNFKCYDQGALQFLIEENNLVDYIHYNERYNYGINEDCINCIFDYYNLIYNLKKQGVKIVHFFHKPIFSKIYFDIDIYNSLKRYFMNPYVEGEIVTMTKRKSPLGLS